MKRFYETVAVSEAAGGFGVLLDGKALRTPGKKPLVVPSRPLAQALAEEWAAQVHDIRPDTMHFMKLVSTALDHVTENAQAVAAEVAKYAGTDLLCHRAERPRELVEREGRIWQPLLDWAMLRFDAPLRVTTGILPAEQPADSLKALHAVLSSLDALTLTGVADLTGICGSLILALAIWDGRLDTAAAIEAVLLDETFQSEQWGEDTEAMQRRAHRTRELDAAARFLGLLRG
jgi:chaperone required for assembly of F1-ATPase